MRKPDQPLEPSIEEILASIRKIIADDGAQGAGGGVGPIFSQAAPDVSPRNDPTNELKPRRTSLGQSIVSEPEEPAEPSGDDEIMELTEDFMLDDEAADDGDSPAKPILVDEPSALTSLLADTPSGPQAGQTALANVFSSVAAEVERIASGQQRPAEENAASPAQDDWNGSEDVRHAVETYAAALSSRAQDVAARETDDEASPKAAAQHAGAAGGAPVNPAPNAPRPQSRPVWSARHLEGDRAGVREKPRARPAAKQPEPPARPHAAARDSWAEGVQMPVPETGPAVPFGSSMEYEGQPPLTPANEAPGSDIEHEREYVGGILTRVFGRMAKKDKEASSTAAAQLVSKAEQIAKEAVSDFAADKLGAPSVADVLHADKPFMDTIADSLESELAKIQTRESAKPALGGRLETVSPAEPQPAPYDELPDALLPMDSELAPFGGAPRQPPRASAQAQTPAQGPAAKPPFAEPSAAPHAEAPREPAQAPAAILATIPEGLENSIKELIKPLIIQWLNDNLPRIVEKAVREELADQGGVGGFRREGGVRR